MPVSMETREGEEMVKGLNEPLDAGPKKDLCPPVTCESSRPYRCRGKEKGTSSFVFLEKPAESRAKTERPKILWRTDRGEV